MNGTSADPWVGLDALDLGSGLTGVVRSVWPDWRRAKAARPELADALSPAPADCRAGWALLKGESGRTWLARVADLRPVPRAKKGGVL